VSERIRVYVQLRPNMEMTAAEVLDHCRVALASFKIPDEVRLVESLPLSAVQTIERAALREQARKELEQTTGY